MSLWQQMIQQFSSDPTVPELATAKTISHTEPSRNYQALEQLIDSQQSFQLVTPEGSRHQSLALQLDRQNNTLIVDEPMPTLAPWLTNSGQQLRLEHRLGTHMLLLNCHVEAQANNPLLRSIALKLPSNIEYQPRRQDPRLAIRKDRPLTVKLLSDLGDAWFASIENISAGGLRVNVGGNISDRLGIGAVLPMCHFRLSPDLTIQSQVRICAYRFARSPHRHTEISLQFHKPPAEQQRRLAAALDLNQSSALQVA